MATIVRVVWAVTVVVALVVLARGLWAGVYFEPTGEALAEARRGQLAVGSACCLLLFAARCAVLTGGRPRWVGLAVGTPVLVCGGLALLSSDTLLPVLATVVAFPAALAGVVGGLCSRYRPWDVQGVGDGDVRRW